MRGSSRDLTCLVREIHYMEWGAECARLVTLAGRGHAPALNVPAQFELAGGFFS
jgi:hypothetical protein